MGDEVWIGGGPPPRKIDPYEGLIKFAMADDSELKIINENLKGPQQQFENFIAGKNINSKPFQKLLLSIKLTKLEKQRDRRIGQIYRNVKKSVKSVLDSDDVMRL